MATAHIRGVDIDHDVLGGGQGLPLVWGHGLTSSRANEDEHPFLDVPSLASDRLVVRYDARGHGESGAYTDPAQGGWDELGRDQVALIDHLGIDAVVVGGASMGVGTALHAAPLLGDRLRGLLLVIPPTGWETRQAQAGLYLERADVVERDGVEPLIAEMWTAPTPDPYEPDEHRARTAARMRAADRGQLAAAFRAAATADLPDPEAIAAIAVPTLVLAWTGDPGHPAVTAERLGELIADAEVVIASTADEMATWTDRARAFLATL